MSQPLTIEYRRLSEIPLWKRNPKLHEFESIIASIKKYGFKDPPAFDNTLEAIVEGNGRIQALRIMQERGEDCPVGILETAEDWLIPLVVGNDLETRNLAEAYAIDHNNLTMLGSQDFSPEDAAKMWEATIYETIIAELKEADEIPVTMMVNKEDMDFMLSGVTAFESDSSNDSKDEIPTAPIVEPVIRPLTDNLDFFEREVFVEKGEAYKLGAHVLVCADVHNIDEWITYYPLVVDPHFSPYPGPFLTFFAGKHNLFMVQPNEYICSHILAYFKQMYNLEPELL